MHDDIAIDSIAFTPMGVSIQWAYTDEIIEAEEQGTGLDAYSSTIPFEGDPEMTDLFQTMMAAAVGMVELRQERKGGSPDSVTAGLSGADAIKASGFSLGDDDDDDEPETISAGG